MRYVSIVLVSLLVLPGCNQQRADPQGKGGKTGASQANADRSLSDARRGFKTKLARQERDGEAPPMPPPKVFRLVSYDAPPGKLAAYLTPKPPDGQKHPAIIWITGGDCNSIGEVWKPAPPENDQTASAFRKAGIVMMFPSLRGGNNNPGVKEGFYGEVDDILAAFDFLAKQDYVDSQKIYLGGHSTGGTLVLLTAACTDRFRAVFSFGPVDDVTGYGPEYCPFSMSDPAERELRAPSLWLHSVKCPTFVFEGTDQGNLDSLQIMSRLSKNPALHFHPVRGRNHFSLLDPVTRLLAGKILRDSGGTTNITIEANEL
jgi:acetyl esterase/lipase